MARDLHRLGEERSIAMHRAVAERLREDPSVLQKARDRVQSWLETGNGAHPRYAEAWRDVLGKSPREVVAFLVDPGEHATALRQSSPFAFALDARTRWKIHRAVARSSE